MIKGIVLAGGSGSRLHPITQCISKQLLPIYDKPMIYYPISTLMLAGIREILIISTPRDLPLFRELLKDGSQWGVFFDYVEQPNPGGLAEAFILGEKFIAHDSVCMILGDNIFYGYGLASILKTAVKNSSGATVFGYHVKHPERYGVAVFDSKCSLIDIEEKPKHPKSNYAITGLYIYNSQVTEYAKFLKPSQRGELEITDLNRIYLKNNRLEFIPLNRGFTWLDIGTQGSLFEASHFLATLDNRQGLKVGSPDEIAWRQGFINNEQLENQIKKYANNDYGKYLLKILEEL